MSENSNIYSIPEVALVNSRISSSETNQVMIIFLNYLQMNNPMC